MTEQAVFWLGMGKAKADRRRTLAVEPEAVAIAATANPKKVGSVR